MASGVTPQWGPPPELQEPFVRRLLPADRFDWERSIRGWIPSQYYGIALMLATFGDKDGTSIHPGEELLAASLQVTTRTVRNALGWLDAQGWITREYLGGKAGSRRGFADIYRLSIPAPHAAHAGRWTADKGQQWVEHNGRAPRAYVFPLPDHRKHVSGGGHVPGTSADCPPPEI